MNLQDYKIRNSTNCECGYEFTIKNLTKLEKIKQDGFYGGIVKHFSNCNCPNCKKDTILFLKQVGQTYVVKDIAQKETEKTEEIIEEVVEESAEAEGLEESTEEITTEETTVNSNEENINSNEFICPTCKNTFKSKSGLAIHSKTCKK